MGSEGSKSVKGKTVYFVCNVQVAIGGGKPAQDFTAVSSLTRWPHYSLRLTLWE